MLEAWAAKRVEGAKVNGRVCGSAEPAPLILTVAAGHVVAATHLLDHAFALLALLNVCGLDNKPSTCAHSLISL